MSTDTLTPEAELQALKDLVDSDGWAVLQRHLETAWGDAACLDQIDAALAKASTIDDELAITKRIRDTFKGVRAEAKWVRARITDLEGAIKKRNATPTIADRFALHRRIPR